MGGVLTTLASSGDNWVKMLIVGGIILNTVLTKHNGSGINKNNKELDQLRIVASRQIKSVYDNQRFLFDFVDETRASQDRIQAKLGIEHPAYTPYPRMEIPDEYLYPQQYP